MVTEMCEVQFKERKGSKDLMLLLNLNETMDQLAVENGVHLYGYAVRMEDGHVIRRALDIEVEGQRKKGRPKRNGKSIKVSASI